MDKKYIITENDLVGDIKGFPIEVVEKMIEEQVKQGGNADVEVFQNYSTAGDDENGFAWDKTEDGYDFWEEVIGEHHFDVFFKKYPKKPNLVYIVGDSNIGDKIIKTLEKNGGINEHRYNGTENDCLYYINPNNNVIEICDFVKQNTLYEVLLATYTPIEVENNILESNILEVSMEEIAEKFGVDVSNLRIKA